MRIIHRDLFTVILYITMEVQREKKNLKFLNVFVNLLSLPLGVIENESYKKYELLCFLVYYGLVIYITFGIIVGLLATSDLDAKGMQLGQFTTHMTSLTMTLYYKLSIDLVLQLISKLRENGDKYEEAALKMEKFISGFIFKVFCGYYGSILLTILPVLMSIPSTVEINEKLSYLIPFWYSCGENEMMIFSKICWKVDDLYELFISNMIQSLLYALTLHSLIMFLLFYNILTTNVKIHSELINVKCRMLAEESKKSIILSQVQEAGADEQEWFEHSNEKIEILFKDILQHQQFIRSFTIHVTHLLQWMVMICLIGIFTSLTMTIFFTLVEKNTDAFVTSKLAGMSLIMIVTLFVYCYNAQIITDLNAAIFDGMLDIPWFRYGMSFRKKYILALTLNQISVNVKACGMYEVNLLMFQSFMKAIYSVINLMKIKY